VKNSLKVSKKEIHKPSDLIRRLMYTNFVPINTINSEKQRFSLGDFLLAQNLTSLGITKIILNFSLPFIFYKTSSEF
jgi:hypothetical protein